ncbi:unnamed protein product [Discosporangium mesarthrocarpum]
MALEVTDDKGKTTSLMLQGVLWVPGLPCRLLSTGCVRRKGGEFVDSGIRRSYIKPSRDARKIYLVERGAFLLLEGSLQVAKKTRATANASYANKHQRLTLRDWHNILVHINPFAIKHLEKRGLIEITDAKVASEMQCSVCKECKAEALSYGRGGRSPKRIGEVVHTDLEGPFNADVTGMRYFLVFVDEASRHKRVFELTTKDAAAAATTAYLDDMARGVPVTCISGDGAGELARSVRFQRMLADQGIKWRKSPPYTPQSNGIAEQAIKQLMQATRSQLVRSGLGEEFLFFAVADAVFKSSGMPHEYLGGETPSERLTGKPFNYNRLRVWGRSVSYTRTRSSADRAPSFTPMPSAASLWGTTAPPSPGTCGFRKKGNS